MKKRHVILLTEEQDILLNEKLVNSGFRKKSDYIRYIVFMHGNFEEKINKIYEKVCGKNGIQ